MANTISFRYSDKQDVVDLAEDEEVNITDIYHAFTDALLEDSMMRGYIMSQAKGADTSLEEFAKNELELPDDLKYEGSGARNAVETMTRGYILGERETFLDGVEQLDRFTEEDLAPYAAEQLDRAYDRLR